MIGANLKSSKVKSVLCASVLLLLSGVSRAGMVVDFSADIGVVTSGKNVTAWRDQSGSSNNAVTSSSTNPVYTRAIVNGTSHPVVRFDGTNYLIATPHVPATGTIFLVYSNAAPPSDTRVIGWDESSTGINGIAIIPNYSYGGLVAAARNNAVAGDVSSLPPASTMEVDTLSWGSDGVILERRLATGEVLIAINKAITSVTDGGFPLHIGAPGDYPHLSNLSQPFQGDLAALRVYDEQLPAVERTKIASDLYFYWLGAGFIGTPGNAACRDESLSGLPAAIRGNQHDALIALGYPDADTLNRAIKTYCAK